MLGHLEAFEPLVEDDVCEALLGVATTAIVPSRGAPLEYYNHGVMSAEHILLEEVLFGARLFLLLLWSLQIPMRESLQFVVKHFIHDEFG